MVKSVGTQLLFAKSLSLYSLEAKALITKVSMVKSVGKGLITKRSRPNNLGLLHAKCGSVMSLASKVE